MSKRATRLSTDCTALDGPLDGILLSQETASPIRRKSVLLGASMGLRCQRYAVGTDDTLYRKANAAYGRTLHDADSHRIMLFAGQRVRAAEVIVEFMASTPLRVVRLAYSMLVIDANGSINSNAHVMQQATRVGLALAPVVGNRARTDSLIDATERFVAGGGSWKPSKNLARAIEDAALGNRNCLRL